MMKAKKQPELGCLLDCVCTHANTMRPVNQETIKLLIFLWTAMLASKCFSHPSLSKFTLYSKQSIRLSVSKVFLLNMKAFC